MFVENNSTREMSLRPLLGSYILVGYLATNVESRWDLGVE